ncbi:MAG: response regulator transcription factor [Steroidobacteraceae bacterium]|nr:response regulator transcription factor [Steroidobacteraceae bacterium]
MLGQPERRGRNTEPSSLAQARSAQDAANDPTVTTKLRVLLIEDSALLRERLQSMFAQYPDLEIVAYSESEQDALKKIAEVEHDALVVDLELKPGSGIPVIRRAKIDRPHVPVIVLTNYDLPTVRDRCRAAGADRFFDKMREIHRLIPSLQELAGRAV